MVKIVTQRMFKATSSLISAQYWLSLIYKPVNTNTGRLDWAATVSLPYYLAIVGYNVHQNYPILPVNLSIVNMW